MANVFPADVQVDVELDAAVVVTFSERMDAATVEAVGVFTLEDGAGTPVTGLFTWDADDEAVTFQPAETLAPSTTYTLTITVAAQDESGNGLASEYTITFTTRGRIGGLYGGGGCVAGGGAPSALVVAVIALLLCRIALRRTPSAC